MLIFNRTLTFRLSILSLTVCLREGTVRIWADQIFKATVTKCPTKMVTLVTAVYQIQCKDTLLSRIMSMTWGNLPWFALWYCASSANSWLKSDAKLRNLDVPAKFFRPTGPRGRYKGRHERHPFASNIEISHKINQPSDSQTNKLVNQSINKLRNHTIIMCILSLQRTYVPTLNMPTLEHTDVRTYQC